MCRYSLFNCIISCSCLKLQCILVHIYLKIDVLVPGGRSVVAYEAVNRDYGRCILVILPEHPGSNFLPSYPNSEHPMAFAYHRLLNLFRPNQPGHHSFFSGGAKEIDESTAAAQVQRHTTRGLRHPSSPSRLAAPIIPRDL